MSYWLNLIVLILIIMEKRKRLFEKVVKTLMGNSVSMGTTICNNAKHFNECVDYWRMIVFTAVCLSTPTLTTAAGETSALASVLITI